MLLVFLQYFVNHNDQTTSWDDPRGSWVAGTGAGAGAGAGAGVGAGPRRSGSG